MPSTERKVFMLDISKPEHEVEVRIARDGKTLWINVDGFCRLRVCGIISGTLKVEDERKAGA